MYSPMSSGAVAIAAAVSQVEVGGQGTLPVFGAKRTPTPSAFSVGIAQTTLGITVFLGCAILLRYMPFHKRLTDNNLLMGVCESGCSIVYLLSCCKRRAVCLPLSSSPPRLSSAPREFS